MTDYCTSSDIVENIKDGVFSSSTAVTSSALSAMIAQESAVIDQHVTPRYTLPLSDASALLFLKKICIDLVVYRVTKVLQPKTATPAPDGSIVQDISHSSAYREAMKMLKSIMDGKMTLPGEAVKSVSFFGSTGVDDDHEGEFESGERQW